MPASFLNLAYSIFLKVKVTNAKPKIPTTTKVQFIQYDSHETSAVPRTTQINVEPSAKQIPARKSVERLNQRVIIGSRVLSGILVS